MYGQLAMRFWLLRAFDGLSHERMLAEAILPVTFGSHG
jgi:hypothetical protein